MKQQKKHPILSVIGLGVLLGLGILAVQFAFRLDQVIVWKWYLRAAPVVILGAVLVNMLWQLRFQRRAAALTNILTKEQDPQRFIAETGALLERASHPYNLALLYINQSVGYAYLNRFDEAKRTLLQAPPKGLKGLLGVTYFLNLTYYCFRLAQQSEALALWQAHEREFSRFEASPNLAGAIALTRIYALLAQGERAQAEQAFTALEASPGAVTAEELAAIREKLTGRN